MQKIYLSFFLLFLSLFSTVEADSTLTEWVKEFRQMHPKRKRPLSSRAFVFDKECASSLCERLSFSECQNQNTYQHIQRSCRGQFQGDCWKKSLEALKLKKFQTVYDYTRLANGCAGNVNSDCLEFILDSVVWFEKDEIREVSAMARSCSGNLDHACLEYVCKKDPLRCDKRDSLQTIARACAEIKWCSTPLCRSRY